jgi:carbamoyl-phosphate synthase large subunit
MPIASREVILQSDANSLNLLFTSAGRRNELLRAFRRAFEELDIHGNIIVADIDPLAPAIQEADLSYIVPRVDDPGYVPELVNICKQEDIRMIFPLLDPDIPVLASNKEVLETDERLVVVVPEAAARLTADKWSTHQFLTEMEVPTPRSWLPEDVQHGEMAFPLFIKPRMGSAGKNTFKVEDKRQLEFFLDYVSEPIVQEYLPGPEITNDVICSLEGELKAVVSRERIEVRWGEVAKGRTIYSEEILQNCMRIAEALEAIGPITVQCMMSDKGPRFTEVNARFGGGIPLGIAAGVNSPLWYVAEAAGLKVSLPPLGTDLSGLYITRFDESYFISEDTYKQIDGHRL